MMTLRLFSDTAATVPLASTWLIGDLGVALGRQELFTRQSPQKLKVLREHALIESAVSSNRIEGVEVDQKRVGTLMFGSPMLRDRDEEEVRGYRSALDLIHREGASWPITEATTRQLHQLTRGEIWDAGKYKQKTEPIIERFSDGRSRIRFMPVEAGPATDAAMSELFVLGNDLLRDHRVNPLIVMAGFTLDFLCIHPFRDGNGRVSRLLMLQLAYHAGAEVGRYISLERLIEQNKQRYYETLEESSQDWHTGRHNPWPFVNYVLWVLKEAYKEFEQRAGETAEPVGAKAELVRQAICHRQGSFRVADLERACPAVGRDWIRKILRQMKAAGELHSFGHGAGSRWERTDSNNKGSDTQ
ncbi:MAG: Fic family protein [Phycisphaerae bacterium]